jgi:hypothetical protein
MILVYLHAGVGNHMFQYASLKGLARRWGVDFGVGQITFDIAHRTSHDWFLEKIESVTSPTSYFEQPVSEHVGVPTTEPIIGDRVLVKGFYQHEDNFSHIADEIRTQFSESPRVATQLDATGFVWASCWTIHFRLGDYLVNRHHFVNLTEYYLACIEQIPCGTTLIVVCEDSPTIEKVYPQVWATIRDRAIVGPKMSEEFDMYLMSRCAGVICSNSTFAWWGAWLGRPKKVFLPDKWFRDDNRCVPMRNSVIKKVHSKV